MFTFNNIAVSFNGDCFSGYRTYVPPPPKDYNPLNLPQNTVRVITKDHKAPYKDTYTTYDSVTASGIDYTYYDYYFDVYKSGSNFDKLLRGSSNVRYIIGGNTEGITSMNEFANTISSLESVALFDTTQVTGGQYMFGNCPNLVTVADFDTPELRTMYSMLEWCTSLSSIPLFDTSKVTSMSYAFQGCYKVQSGALALYQQASTQATPPAYYKGCFRDCGRYSQTGSAELAQIPSDWK